MKSVGIHPNIVGIVGHCIKNLDEMMLLTEYCSNGNLLNFLRLVSNPYSNISPTNPFPPPALNGKKY